MSTTTGAVDPPRPTSSTTSSRSSISQAKILDAAVRVLIAEGYAGASTLRVQREAGVSRGRLLHYFSSRDELLVAAVSHLATGYMSASASSLSHYPDGSVERIDAAVASMWSNYQQDHFWAATELWLAARHHAELAAALQPVEHRLGEEVRSAVDAYFGPTFCAHPAYRGLREQLNTSMRGVALTYAFNGRRSKQAADPHLRSWCDLAARELLDGSGAGR